MQNVLKKLFLYISAPSIIVAQYVPSFNKAVASMDPESALTAECNVTVSSNQTLMVYGTPDCSDRGWQLGPLNYFTSTPANYAFQSIQLSREGSILEHLIFSSLGANMGSYWHERSDPLQVLWGSYPSYCGTYQLNLTLDGEDPFAPGNESECINLVDESILVRPLIHQIRKFLRGGH